MSEAEHAFVATFGNKRVKGHTFTAVCDVLASEGFLLAKAKPVDTGVIKVPHKARNRAAATIEKRNGHPVEVEPEPVSVEVAAAEMAGRGVLSGTAQPVGLQTRECGAVHSEGVVCFIAVLYEPLSCGCGDYVYEHDGPHEAVDDSGVRYRWEAVLIIQDLPFNMYGPMDEEAGA